MSDRQSGAAGTTRPDLAQLLAAATSRALLTGTAGKSGARLERLEINGRSYVLKHLDLASDWTMRASGSLRGAPLELWERGVLDRMPDCISQPIVAVACGAARRPASPRAAAPSSCTTSRRGWCR